MSRSVGMKARVWSNEVIDTPRSRKRAARAVRPQSQHGGATRQSSAGSREHSRTGESKASGTFTGHPSSRRPPPVLTALGPRRIVGSQQRFEVLSKSLPKLPFAIDGPLHEGAADGRLDGPLYVGRAVAALAQDPKIMKRTGQLLSSWELAREYSFTDADGTRPDWGKAKLDFSRHPQGLLDYTRSGGALSLEWLETVTKRTKSFMKHLSKEANRGKPGPRNRTRPGRTRKRR